MEQLASSNQLPSPVVRQIETGTGFAQRGFEVATLDQAWDFAGKIASTKFVPRGMEKAEDIFAAICYGVELGLPVMTALQSVAVVNGRPSIYGDTALALVRASGHLESIIERFEGEGDERAAVCIVKRFSDPEPVEIRFSMADAKRAKLWGKAGPWTEYPQRMMRFRARGWALRDAFGDVLRGLYTHEEAADLKVERNITPEKLKLSKKPSLTKDSPEKETVLPAGEPEDAVPSKAPEESSAGKTNIADDAPSPLDELWLTLEGHGVSKPQAMSVLKSLGLVTGNPPRITNEDAVKALSDVTSIVEAVEANQEKEGEKE